MSPDPRLVDNSYWLREPLGQGGMASVYCATCRLTGEAVALKLVTQERMDSNADSESDEFRLRLALLREFQTLASLHHPNVVEVLGYGLDGGRHPYFTMELLEQPQDIVTAAHEQPLSVKVDLLVQLLRALNYVHRRGLLHRDVKPSEVWSEAEQVRKREVGSGRRRKSTFHGFHYRWWLLELGLMRQFRASAWPGSGRFLIVQGDALNSARHGRPL